MLNNNQIRRIILDVIYEKQSGHLGSCLSAVEIFNVLYTYFDVVGKDSKDKLINSKGHSVLVQYVILYLLGHITLEELNTYKEINSNLQGHNDHLKCKFLQNMSGSLGQGPSVAVGHALALKRKNSTGKVFCLIGDGEISGEGSCYEALMFAGKHKLNNLVFLIDFNKSQNDGKLVQYFYYPDGSDWDINWVDGHDTEEILETIQSQKKKPLFIICSTDKGYPVSFMMGDPSWHNKIPTKQEYDQAIKELT